MPLKIQIIQENPSTCDFCSSKSKHFLTMTPKAKMWRNIFLTRTKKFHAKIYTGTTDCWPKTEAQFKISEPPWTHVSFSTLSFLPHLPAPGRRVEPYDAGHASPHLDIALGSRPIKPCGRNPSCFLHFFHSSGRHCCPL